MKNKKNIHKLEEVGFFVTMAIVSIIIGTAIVVGMIKLVDIFNN